MSKVLVELIETEHSEATYVVIDGRRICSMPIKARELGIGIDAIFDAMNIENVEVVVK